MSIFQYLSLISHHHIKVLKQQTQSLSFTHIPHWTPTIILIISSTLKIKYVIQNV